MPAPKATAFIRQPVYIGSDFDLPGDSFQEQEWEAWFNRPDNWRTRIAHRWAWACDAFDEANPAEQRRRYEEEMRSSM